MCKLQLTDDIRHFHIQSCSKRALLKSAQYSHKDRTVCRAIRRAVSFSPIYKRGRTESVCVCVLNMDAIADAKCRCNSFC